MDRDPTALGADLAKWMAERQLTQAMLCVELSGCFTRAAPTQSWVSRIKDGRFTRITARVRTLLDYANIPTQEEGLRSEAARRVVDDAIDGVWDGTLAGAEAVARVLRSAAELGAVNSRGGSAADLAKPAEEP